MEETKKLIDLIAGRFRRGKDSKKYRTPHRFFGHTGGQIPQCEVGNIRETTSVVVRQYKDPPRC